jgi:hypothetical protein
MLGRRIAVGCIVAALVVFLLGGLLLLPFAGLWFSFHRRMSVHDHTLLSLPDGVHAIEHARILTHPLVAEYSREVTYLTNGARGKTTPLHVDTCGGYPINCYLIEAPQGPMLRLDDAVSEHLLDISTQTTYMIVRVKGTPYVGELMDESASSGWSIMNNDPSTLSVTIGGVKAKPMADLTQNAPGVYIGRLDGGLGHLRFIPATESPEIAIDHLFDRHGH